MAQPSPDGQFSDTGVGISDRLERLWAPYRMNYIVNRVPGAKKENPFTQIPLLDDEEGLIVAHRKVRGRWG